MSIISPTNNISINVAGTNYGPINVFLSPLTILPSINIIDCDECTLDGVLLIYGIQFDINKIQLL